MSAIFTSLQRDQDTDKQNTDRRQAGDIISIDDRKRQIKDSVTLYLAAITFHRNRRGQGLTEILTYLFTIAGLPQYLFIVNVT